MPRYSTCTYGYTFKKVRDRGRNLLLPRRQAVCNYPVGLHGGGSPALPLVLNAACEIITPLAPLCQEQIGAVPIFPRPYFSSLFPQLPPFVLRYTSSLCTE